MLVDSTAQDAPGPPGKGWQPWRRYASAAAALLVAVAGQLALQPVVAPTPFLLIYGAVVFSAWACGRWPTLLVVALADLLAPRFFLPPGALERWLAVAGFTSVSLLIVALGERARESYAASDALARELRLGEERWRSLAEAIPQIVWTADAQGKIDYCNQRWLELTGHTIDEARRLGWPATVHPDDVPAVVERWAAAIAGGTLYEVESRLKRKSDGAYRWFLSRGVPVREGAGRVVKWFGTSTDIDDQKRAAERARFLSEASSQLSSSLDYEDTLRRVSRAAVPAFADWASVDLTGPGGAVERVAVAHQDPAMVALAHELTRKYPPRPDDPVGVAHVLRTGQAELLPAIPDELLVQAIPDPELLRIVRELRLRSSIVAPIVARGRTLGAISFVMAESGRSYGEGDLAVAVELGQRAGIALDHARLYRDAQQASRIKDEFLSTLSHELRTPLTAILGWSHILASGPDAAKVSRGVEVIARNARAQAQLVDDLLDVSRIVTGKMRLSVRPFDPLQIIEAALEAVRPSADAKGVRVAAALDPGAGPLLGDPDRLQQVVWNLLSNAMKFTPRGGRVQVRLAREGSHVEIEVSDTGQGIPAPLLQQIFERFVQVDASVSRAHGGLGLGLSIARHLVELHGGTIEAASPGPGAGATFTVKLPLAAIREQRAVEDLQPGAALRLAPRPTAPGLLRGMVVLVVEDSVDARELIVEVLAEAGARVVAAGSVAEAQAKLSLQAPDLFISDIGMPGEDGYTLIRSVRQAGHRFPAIALTAHAHAHDRARAISEGFDLHLPKPVDPGELIASAAALLRRRAG